MRPVAFVLGLICLLAVACGGDKKPSETSNRAPANDAPASSERLVSAEAALGGAARNAAEVESFRGTMEMEMDFGAMRFGFDGEMAYEAPDATHMQMSMLGMDMEMLVYGTNLYMRMDGADWMKLDLTNAGIDLSQFEDLAENQGFFDLEEMARSLGDVEELPDVDIDGKTYKHYRAEPDFADFADQLPAGAIDPSLAAEAEDMIDAIEVEFWIDPETELPRRFEMTMSMDMPTGESGDMLMAFDYVEYNVDVDIPAEPVGAPAFDPSSLGG
jgi:hypothetical protein